MKWTVIFHKEFEPEFKKLPEKVQNELLSNAKVLAQIGPALGRPIVDTLKNSKHSNMKEMRFSIADGVWRVAFAFDPNQEAVLLVAGDKSGVGKKFFYKSLIKRADKRFDQHLAALREKEK